MVIKRSLLLLALSSVPLLSNAFDFKGVELGTTVTPQQVREQLDLKCRAKGTEQVCRGTTTVAGQRAIMELTMDRAGTVQMMLFALKPEHFAAVENALTSKFGDPESKERKPIQNRMGATFEQASDRWANERGDSVVLMKYLGDIKTSMLMFSTKSNSDAMKDESLGNPNDL